MCDLSALICFDMYLICVGYVVGMFWVCFGVCDLCAGTFWYVVDMFLICFGYVLGMFWHVLCLRQNTLVCF